MKKSVKRFLSTVLALTMLCSCMAVMNVSAFAAEAAAAAVGKSVNFDEEYSADLENAENAEYTAAYTQAANATLNSTNTQNKVYIPISSSAVSSGTVIVSGKFTATKNSSWEFLGLANSSKSSGPCVRTGSSNGPYTLRIDSSSSSDTNLTSDGTSAGSTLAFDNTEHTFTITVNFSDISSSKVYVKLDVDGYYATGYSSNMASDVKYLYISTSAVNTSSSARYVTISKVTATIGETTSNVTISSYDTSASTVGNDGSDYVYTNEVEMPASATLTSSASEELLSTMPILDEDDNAVTVDAGKLVISGSFQKSSNTAWSFIRLCDEDGSIVTAIRADASTASMNSETGLTGSGKYLLGNSSTNSSGSTSIKTSIDNDDAEHDYILTVDFDDTDASGNVKVSLDLDDADTVSYYTAISSVASIQLQTSTTSNNGDRYVTISNPTITAAGTKYYVIFAVSDDEAEAYSSFDILNNGTAALEEEDVVYTGIDFGEEDEYAPASGYVVAYRVKGADSSDDFSSKFTMDLND
ncbi:MAG: hypothetical protein LUC97_02185 [Clostridiales bacterium]|nr:hypothetical protein [Clostridiales bacterium]